MRASPPFQLLLHPAGALRLRRVACSTIILCSVLAGCGGGSTGTAAEQASPVVVALPGNAVPTVPPGNWVVMGSSTAAGAGAPAGKGWVAILQANWSAKGYALVNLAKSGITTYDGLSASSPPVANRPLPDPTLNIDQALTRSPKLLFLSFPTNDTAAGYGTDESVNNVLAMRAKALAASVPVIVLSTQPRALTAPRQQQLLDIDRRLTKEVGTCFVAVHAKLAGPDDKLAAIYDSGDGVHPNAAGHAVIAGAVEDVMRNSTCVHVAT